MTVDPLQAHEPDGGHVTIADETEGAMKRRPGRTLVQFPITENERRTLKHKAIDQGVTLGEVVRRALGFPVRMPAEKTEATTS